jgi:hypothetical protein
MSCQRWSPIRGVRWFLAPMPVLVHRHITCITTALEHTARRHRNAAGVHVERSAIQSAMARQQCRGAWLPANAPA